MARVPSKRPRRYPLTSEEVTHIIAHNKKRELLILRRFKKSSLFKALNVFNVACIFIYLEVIFCYFGPCHYQKHYSVKTVPHYNSESLRDGKRLMSEIDIYNVDGREYKFVIGQFIEAPYNRVCFITGKDFLLQKELKGSIENSEQVYRLFSASPILILCFLAAFFSFFGFVMNLNENVYTLGGLSSLNFLAMLAIILI